MKQKSEFPSSGFLRLRCFFQEFIGVEILSCIVITESNSEKGGVGFLFHMVAEIPPEIVICFEKH